MQLEEQVRDALAQEAAFITDDRVARVGAIEYHPRGSMTWTRLSGVALAGAAASAGAVVLLAGTSTQAAFAGWRATPTHASTGRTTAVESACAARLGQGAKNAPKSKNVAAKLSTQPLVADTRGPFTLVVYNEATCFAGPGFMGLHGVQPADGVEISTGYRGEPFTISSGPAPTDASGATLTLQDGSTVQATVANSVFAAWWPSVSRPTQVAFTTPSGTQTQPLNFPPAPEPKGRLAKEKASLSRKAQLRAHVR
jgi:hypothetical protein